MSALRLRLKLHRWLAAWLIVAALAVKVVVPAGFMPVFSAHSIMIQMCSGSGPQQMTMAMPDMPATGDHAPGKSGQGGKDMPCGFGGLAAPLVAAADPVLLAVALWYILAAGLSERAGGIAASIRYLRPPLRGPPHTA